MALSNFGWTFVIWCRIHVKPIRDARTSNNMHEKLLKPQWNEILNKWLKWWQIFRHDYDFKLILSATATVFGDGVVTQKENFSFQGQVSLCFLWFMRKKVVWQNNWKKTKTKQKNNNNNRWKKIKKHENYRSDTNEVFVFFLHICCVCVTYLLRY